MKNTIYRFLVKVLFICGISFNADAGYLVVISEVDFSTLIGGRAGQCSMDSTTAIITDVGGSIICQQNNTGTLGHYRIFTDPFRTVDITVRTKNIDLDAVQFIPDGTISSSAESKAIVPDNVVQVQAGASGIINIIFGGVLNITDGRYAAETSYSFSVSNGVEWVEQ